MSGVSLLDQQTGGLFSGISPANMAVFSVAFPSHAENKIKLLCLSIIRPHLLHSWALLWLGAQIIRSFFTYMILKLVGTNIHDKCKVLYLPAGRTR